MSHPTNNNDDNTWTAMQLQMPRALESDSPRTQNGRDGRRSIARRFLTIPSQIGVIPSCLPHGSGCADRYLASIAGTSEGLHPVDGIVHVRAPGVLPEQRMTSDCAGRYPANQVIPRDPDAWSAR